MFSGLVRKEWLFRAFVFNMFSGLGICGADGQNVVLRFRGWRLARCTIVDPFLPGGPGGEASDQASKSRMSRLPGLSHRSLMLAY